MACTGRGPSPWCKLPPHTSPNRAESMRLPIFAALVVRARPRQRIPARQTPAGYRLPCSARRASSTATTMHEGWAVRVRGERIEAAGPAARSSLPGETVTDLPGTTLMPGLIEGHSHVLLHPYDETTWNDQVLKESLGVRTARAVNHLRATLARRLHHHPRSRHRGRRLRRRGAEAGGERRHHSRTAHARRDPRDRRHRELRAEGAQPRMATCRRAPRRPTATR